MNKLVLIFLLACGVVANVAAQAKLRKLPPNINHFSINNYAPYVSLDGNSLVYVADMAEDNELTLVYSVRSEGAWKDPVVLSKVVNTRLNYLKGFGISPDGKTLFISNLRGGGQGGFDLFTSQWTGLMWPELVNMALPINSKSNEASASLSIDGSTLYFMRCEKMDFQKADNCKIMMVTKKPNGQWDQPVELPASINTGNSQCPRIMGDSETLIFSSNKISPSKGGMDLYLTRLVNGKWSNPVPLDFANTSRDDQFVSATSLGRYLMVDAPGTKKNELVEVLFPPEIRPRSTMKIEGTVTGPDNPVAAYVSLLDLQTQKTVFSTKPGKDGTFVAFVKEGSVYDLSIDPDKDNYTFLSKRFDLSGDKFSMIEKVSGVIKPLASGDEVDLEGVSFKPQTAELTPQSNPELRRVVRMMQGNPDKYFSVQVTLLGFEKDSVKSNPDLTEVQVDSIKIPVTYKIDSVTTGTRDSVVVKTWYHNDRTARQARTLCNYLISAGIPAGKLACSGKSNAEAVLEKRRTTSAVIVH